MIKLEEIKARHGKATQGPWLLASGDDESCSSIFGVISEAENQRVEADTRIFRGDFPEDTKWIAVDAGVSPARLADEDNFDFIAASWQDVKDLIEEVERLRLLVADLPRTADDVPVGPGMMVWVMPPKCANPGGFGWTVMEVTRTHVDGRRASEVYSTLPAAREAASREGAVKR